VRGFFHCRHRIRRNFSADFCPFIAPPLDGVSQLWQTDRSPRVLRTHLPPIHPSHLLPRLPDDDRAVCASCSSGRGFAYRFLQTPLHSGSPCDSANGSRHQGP
jgi:hypothetical protein